MKLSCNTIQDMLPLVADNLASEDTAELVSEHIETCKECREEYEEIKGFDNLIDKERIKAIPLKSIKRKLKTKNIYTGVLTVLVVSLIILIGIDKTTKPIPISFNEAIESTKYEDGKIFVKFTPDVTDYDITVYGSNYDIMAWKTNISKVFKSNEAKNIVIDVNEETGASVYYIDQRGELDHRIYGPIYGAGDGEGRLTLPRLAMNYYAYLMGIIFLVFLSLSILFRKKEKIKKIASSVMLLSLSYITSHILILGTRGSTHHMMRDLSFVIAATILIFSIFIGLRYKEVFMNRK